MSDTFDDKSYVGMTRCFFCGEGNDILLDHHLQKTLPRDCGVIDMEPCTKCAELMEQGVILIAVKPESMDAVYEAQRQYRMDYDRANERARRSMPPFIPNPERTGGWFVMKDEAVKRIFNNAALVSQILRARWTFIGEDAARKIGLYDVKPTYATAEEALEKGKENVQPVAEVPGEQGTPV